MNMTPASEVRTPGQSDPAVTIRDEGGVAVVTVNSPPVNTLGNSVLEELLATAETLADAADVRAVILTGAGDKAFASGAKLDEFQDMLGSPDDVAHHTGLTRRAFTAVERLPQPVIAALQASAVGGGLELALSCDLIVADERARLGLPEVTLGLIPGAGGTQRLPRRVGLGRARKLVMLGELIDAAEAERIGLVDIVCGAGQARDRAAELAKRLAALPSVALRAARHALRGGGDRSLEAGLDSEHEQFVKVLASADAREGVAAFLERRPAKFVHR